MNAREWVAGDVAMVRFVNGSSEHRAMRDAAGDGWGVVSCDGSLQVAEARPLVVIDPEDAEQVERLIAAMEDQPMGSDDDLTAAMQTVLREFANPTPSKPLEPTGLGAVVEDAASETWVRVHLGTLAPWRGTQRPDENRPLRYFKDIDVTSVLSEGVL